MVKLTTQIGAISNDKRNFCKVGHFRFISGYFAIRILSAMFSMKLVALAFVGTAAAFNPIMQMTAGRRVAIQGAGAAAVAAPFLRPAESDAAVVKYEGNMRKNPLAPVVTLLDHRGCNRASKEYKGEKAGDIEDEMIVILKMENVAPGKVETTNFVSQQLGQLQF